MDSEVILLIQAFEALNLNRYNNNELHVSS